MHRRLAALGLGLLLLVVPLAAAADSPPAVPPPVPPEVDASGDPVEVLEEVLELSPAPEYRRFGSPGIEGVADHLANRLATAGYAVERAGGSADRWKVDYSPGQEPLLRLPDGTAAHVESGFWLDGGTTGPDGVTCRLAVPEDVQPGDCGFVDFGTASPEWKNQPFANPRGAIDQIRGAGGVGVVVQGDLERDLVFSLQVRRPIPTVVAVVGDDVVGRTVTIRAMGEREVATMHNVVGYLPPTGEHRGTVLLLAHTDAWFQGAVDNGAGTAAVVAAAERLAAERPAGIGVLVMLVDGEEIGLLGSEELAADLEDGGLAVGPHTARVDDLVAVVNLDAPSAKPSDVHDHVEPLLGDTRIPVFQWRVLVTNARSPEELGLLEPFVSSGTLGMPVHSSYWTEISGGWRTDAEHFDGLGVPVVWPVAGYPEYHTDGDTLDRLDVVDLRSLVDAAVGVVRRLDGTR